MVWTDRIFIPDYPDPHTICCRNLNPHQRLRDKSIFTGPLVRNKYSEIKDINLGRPHVLSMMGGFGYRKKAFEKVVEAAEIDPSINYTFILGPSISEKELQCLPDNIIVKQYLDDPLPFIKASDCVITSGGHSTIMECLSLGVPLLSFPDISHNEQENNASVVQDRGLGFKMSYSVKADELVDKIRLLLDDDSFREKALEYRMMSENISGSEIIRKAIEDSIGKD